MKVWALLAQHLQGCKPTWVQQSLRVAAKGVQQVEPQLPCCQHELQLPWLLPVLLPVLRRRQVCLL